MIIKCILFDFDNTLVDFNQGSVLSMRQSFQETGLTYSDEIYSLFKQINKKIWKDFEEGKIDTVTIRHRRFAILFDELGVDHLNPFDFNARYLNNLITHTALIQGARDVLDHFRKSHSLGLITNGLKEVQRPRLKQVNIYDHFEQIVVSDEIGYSKPDFEYFEHTYNSFDRKYNKEEVLVVGDNPVADIKGAKDYGFRTCWLKPRDSEVNSNEADFEISKLDELRELGL